jgi:hypothetical protein
MPCRSTFLDVMRTEVLGARRIAFHPRAAAIAQRDFRLLREAFIAIDAARILLAEAILEFAADRAKNAEALGLYTGRWTRRALRRYWRRDHP